MAKRKMTIEDLGQMIAEGFNENTEQHRQTFKILDEHTVRLDRIEKKLENVIYRKEFEELRGRVEEIEELLVIKKKI